MKGRLPECFVFSTNMSDAPASSADTMKIVPRGTRYHQLCHNSNLLKRVNLPVITKAQAWHINAAAPRLICEDLSPILFRTVAAG